MSLIPHLPLAPSTLAPLYNFLLTNPDKLENLLNMLMVEEIIYTLFPIPGIAWLIPACGVTFTTSFLFASLGLQKLDAHQ